MFGKCVLVSALLTYVRHGVFVLGRTDTLDVESPVRENRPSINCLNIMHVGALYIFHNAISTLLSDDRAVNSMWSEGGRNRTATMPLRHVQRRLLCSTYRNVVSAVQLVAL